MEPRFTLDELAQFPLDEGRLDEACAEFQTQGDWSGLFALYSSIGSRAPTPADLGVLWRHLEGALRVRANDEENPITAAQILVMSGEVLHRHLGAPERALDAFRTAFKRYPDAAILRQAHSLLGGGLSPEDALDLAEARLAVAADPDAIAEATLALAEAAHRSGHRGRARQELETLLTSRPDHLGAQRILRAVEAEDDRAERALSALRRAVDRAGDAPARARALFRLGEELATRPPEDEELVDPAVQIWLESLAAQPTEDAVRALSRHYRLIGDGGGLQDILESAIRPDAEKGCLVVGHQGLADLALRRGESAAVRTHHEALIHLEPDNRESLEVLSGIHREEKAWEALRGALEARVRIAGHGAEKDALELELAALLQEELGDVEAAAILHGRLRKRVPDHPDVLRFQEARHRAREDWTRLHETLGIRMRQESGKPQFDLALERARLARTHLPLSPREIEAWEDVLSFKPRNREARQRVLQALEQTGRWAGVVAFREAEFSEQHSRGNLSGAMEQLDAVLAVHCDPSRAPSPQAAVDILERILTLDPTRHDALERLAGWHRDRGERDALISVLERCVSGAITDEVRDSLERELVALHGGVEAEAGLALGHLQSLRERHPDDFELLHAERDLHRRAGDLPAVASLIEAELTFLDGRARVPLLDELARISEEELGDPDSAALALRELHSLDPDNAHVFQRLADALEDLLDWEGLADLLGQELDRDLPRSRRIALLDKLAGVQADALHNHDAARMTLVGLTRLHPFHRDARERLRALQGGAESWLGLREIHAEDGDWRGYAAVLEDALQGDLSLDDQGLIHRELADLHGSVLPDPRRQRVHQETALSASPDDMELAHALAGTLEKLGAHAALVEILVTMVEQGDDALRREAIGRLRQCCREARDTAGEVEWACAWLEDLRCEEALPDLHSITTATQGASSQERVLACLAHLAAQERPRLETLRVHLHQGEFLAHRAGRPQDARIAFEEALALDPGHPEALKGLESLLIAEGDWFALRDALEGHISAASDQDTAVTQRLAQLGELCESVLDEPESALDAWRLVLERDPLHEAALGGVKRSCESREAWDELLEVLRRELTQRSEEESRAAVHHQIAALEHHRLGDLEGAVSSYGAVLGHTPAHRPARSALEQLLDSDIAPDLILSLLDRCYSETGSWKPLARILQRQVDRTRDAGSLRELRRRLAHLHSRSLDEPATAWKLLETLVREEPDDLSAWEDLLEIAPHAGATDVLLMLLGTMTGLASPTPGRPAVEMREETREQLLAWQTGLLVEAGRLDEAHAVLEERTAGDPTDLVAIEQHRDVLRALGRWSGLEACLMKLGAEPQRGDDRVSLARLREEELGDLPGAAAAWQEVLRADPEHSLGLVELERLLQALEMGDELCALLQSRVDRHPEDVDLALRLAHAHVTLRDDVVDALGVLSEAWNANPLHNGILSALEVHALSDAAHASGSSDAVLNSLRDHFRDHQEWDRVLRVDHSRLSRCEEAADRSALHLSIARVHGDALGDLEAALTAACEALDAAPDRRDAAEEVVRFAALSGGWRTASEALLDATLHLESEQRIALCLQLGRIARDELMSPEEAIVHYLRALDLEPELLDALSALDQLYLQLDAPEERLAILERSAPLLPGGDQAAQHAAALEVARRVGDAAAEMRSLEGITAAPAAPTDLLVHALDSRIQLHREHGEWEALVATLEQRESLADEPSLRVSLLLQRARALEEGLVDTRAAIATFEHVREIEPSEVAAIDGLLRLYRAEGFLGDLETLLTWRTATMPTGEAWGDTLLELAELLAADPARGLQAVGAYEDILGWNPEDQRALEGLWTLAESGEEETVWASSLFLASSARDRAVPEETVRALRILLDHPSSDLDRASLLQEMAGLLEDRLGDDAGAFDANLEAWTHRPLDQPLWQDVTRLSLDLGRSEQLHEALLLTHAGMPDSTGRLGIALEGGRHFAQDQDSPEFAEELYLRALEENPDHPEAIAGLEDIYRSLQRWDDLAAILGKRIDLQMGPSRTLSLERAEILAKHLGDFIGARDCLQAILDLDPGDADALASLDGVLTSGGEWSDLVGVIGRRAALHEEGSREGARHLVRQLQVVHGRIADASEAQGLAEALLGNAFAEDDALAVLRALFDKGHARGAVLEHLITGYEARANWKHLAECLSARVEDDPEDATALLSQLVHVLRHKIGDDRSAYEHLCRLTERAPDHARLDTLEGIAEQLDCRDDLAARLESWALDQEPTWGLSLDLRAAAIQRGRPHLAEHAIESYRRVLGREPGHALAAEGLLATLEMQGHWEDLVDALISLSTLPERGAERRDLLGRAAGVAEEGLQDPLRAAEIHAIGLVATDSEDPGWGAIERLYQVIDERDRLQSHYAQWAATSPDPEGIHLRHARHLATQTDWEGLLAVVEGALKDAPNHPSLVGFLERIVGDVPVEAEISNGFSARGAVASLLAGTYDEHTPWMNWMHVTDARLSCARDALERRALLVFAGGILRDRAQDPRGAFARYGEALRMAPADATVLDLAVLSAEEADCLEDLLELHASIAADGGEEASSHALKAAILAENRLMDDVRARTLYQQVLVLEPGQGEALDALERHARALGDTPQLRQVLGDRIGASAEPGDQAQWYREIGGLHLQEGNPEEAISALRASLRIGPGMPQTLHDLVDVLRSTGDHAGLVAALNQGAEAADDVQGALAYLHEAADVLEVHLHDLPSAIDMHHRILEETATDALSFGALEQLLPRVEDWDGLTQLLSLRLQGDLPSAERASCHQRLGDIHREHLHSNERALDHYRLALEHAPRHEETIASLESLAATGEHALAASFVLEAEHEASGDHERLCALHALQLPLLDDPSECLDLLDRATRLRCDTLRDPDGAVHLLLDALQGVLDFEVIQPLLDALLEAHPVHDTAVAGLVTRLAGRRIPGDERPLRRWIAWTSERPLGELDEAAHQWRRLVDLDPSNGSDRASLERTLRGQERWGDLVNALEEHLDYAPRESRAERLLELAQLCTDSLLEPHRALSHLRDLLWEDPSDLHAQNALAKLATTAPDACAEIFDILAPIYRQEGRFEPLVELLDAQISWLDDPMEEARSLIQKMEILGTRMHASDRSFEAGIAGLGAAGEVALPHVRAIEEVAAGDPELERLVHALGEAAGGPVSPGVRTDLSLHAARISEERLETPHVAERHLLNVLAEQPQHKEALTRLERLYVQDHRHPELIALCERQVLLPMEAADRVRLLLQIAESSQSIGDTERAIQAMESVLAREPTHPQALSTLRTIHLDQGDAHNAIPLLRLEADQPGLLGSQRIPTLLALAQLQEGSEETRLDAVTSYEDILSHDPLHSEALAGLEALHVAAGRWDALAWVLRQRVKATPPGDQQVDVHRSLGQIHAQHLDEPMIALDCFGQVLHADPCDAVALEGSLRILEGQGMWSDLAEMLQGAIADSGSRRSPGISLRLARVLLERLDDPRGASLAAARALEEDPTSVDALRIAAETAGAADNAPRVLEALEAALRETLVTDQEVGLLRLKGQLLFEYSHEPGAALEALLRAARIAPLNEEVNDLLVRIYRDRGRWDALVGVLERQFGATEDPVGASEIAREIASILKTSLQDSAAAIPWLEKAHSLVPENPSIAEDLVEAHPAHAENARIATLLEWLLADASTRGDHSGVARHAHRLGLLRRSQGDPLGALALQRRAQHSDPRHLKSLFALAMDLMRAGKDAEALIPLQSLQLRQDALEETEKVDVLAALASVADGAGERPKAVLLARRALAIDPDREDLQRLVEDAEITSGENR